MQNVTATIPVGDEGVSAFAALLRQFPAGSRVKLAMTAAGQETALPGLVEYRQRVAEARRRFVLNCPWRTTAEAMDELRAGERD